MSAYFQVAQYEQSEWPLVDDPSVESLSVRTVTVTADRDVYSRVHTVYAHFYEERGEAPAQLLVGWRVWLQLGWELGGRRSLFKPTELVGIPLVIDEQDPDGIRALPGFNRIRFQ